MRRLQHGSHRRFNPLTGQWTLVSPHRASRPWQGQTETAQETATPAHDPECYLCPGNLRANGARNPLYADVYAFDNDFAALLPDTPLESVDIDGLIVAQGEAGACRVICFSPRHDLTLSRMDVAEIEKVVALWRAEFLRFDADPRVTAVQIFENRGAMMGASNPHPHCQIWATQSLPNEIATETLSQESYHSWRGGCLLCDYLALELERGERIVCANDAFVALVPFWAIWPFETLLLPRRHIAALDELTPDAARGLAEILSQMTRGYDNLFSAPFPYTMGFHQRPSDGGAYPGWHFHGHFYPPLLRSATIRKFMVGFELLGSPQRDITPEVAAERLRDAVAR